MVADRGSVSVAMATEAPPSDDPRREVVRYLRKNGHWVLINRLGGLSLSRKSVVRLTDRPAMTIAIDRGR